MGNRITDHPTTPQPDLFRQMAFSGMGAKGEERMEQAKQWVKEHRLEWLSYKTEAQALWAIDKQPVSPDVMKIHLRSKLHTKIPSHLSAYLARIAQAEFDANHVGVKMNLGRSEADTWTAGL